MLVLPLWAARVLRLFAFVLALVLDTVSLLLTPVAWMQLRAHLAAFIGALIAGGYWYITGVGNAVIKASGCFVAFVLVVALVKLLKKQLHRSARRLDKYIVGLLPVCVYVKVPNNPIKKIKTNLRKR